MRRGRAGLAATRDLIRRQPPCHTIPVTNRCFVPKSPGGRVSIGYSGPDYSPVSDLSKYERAEARLSACMVINIIALVFVSLLSLVGFWPVNA